MSIIEKLGITPLEEKEIPQDDCPQCYEHITAETFDFIEVRNKEKIFNEMLEFLINMASCLDRIGKGLEEFSELKLLIQKATNKSWEEIKDLINGN